MPLKSFYKVPPENYLFNQKETDKSHEEKVRQWVLYELMSTYGYSIQQIRVEEYVKMGSSPQMLILLFQLAIRLTLLLSAKDLNITNKKKV